MKRRYETGDAWDDGPEEDWDAGNRRRSAQRRQQDTRRRHSTSRGGRTREEQREPRNPGFLLKLLLIVLLLLAGLYAVVNHAYSKMNYHEITSLKTEPLQADGVINILLIGNDSRENGEDGRSDAMILLSVSTRTKTIAMTSLLRDMYVEIPGHDGNRLNAAYSFGGAELLLETVEQNLGVTVNRYVQVNFEAFANLVDAVGGVDLELSSGEKELVNGYLNEYNELTGKEFGTDYLEDLADGAVHLNGPQALAYTRNRYIGTDFGRTERQRKVLTEVVHQLPKALLHPKELENGLLPNLTTNLTSLECYRMVLMAPFLMRYDLVNSSIPVEGSYQDVTIRKMSVLKVDFDVNRNYLRELLYERKKENTEDGK